jgi:hypothetical protein
MNQLVALQVRPPVFDEPANALRFQQYQAGEERLKNAQTDNQLGAMKLEQASDQFGAEKNFRDRSAAGDPNADEALAGQPEMQKRLYDAFDGMSPKDYKAAKVKATRFGDAARTILMFKDGSREQTDAWNTEITKLADDKIIDSDTADKMIKNGPNPLIIEQALSVEQLAKNHIGKDTGSTALKDEKTRAEIAKLKADTGGNANKPPPGYRYKPNGDMEFIKGGPADPSVKASDAQSALGTGTTGLSGEDFLKTLDKPVADQVRALAEGRMPMPSGFALRSPYWQKMMQIVSQYDPNFDAVNYSSRAKTRNDFTSGKSAQNITSFNTAIAHLGSFADIAEKLDNSNYPAWNSITNFAQGQYDPKTQANLKQFQATKTALTEELTRAFRGSGGNVHDIEEWAKSINAADSPAALKAVVQQAGELLRGRLSAVGDTYNRGMGTTKDPLELLSPKAAETLRRFAPDSGDTQDSAGKSEEELIQDANDAIAAGADPEAVRQELHEKHGIDVNVEGQ